MPCQACGRNAPTKYVEFYQNIGMLVVRSMRSVRGNLCRRCIKKYFLKLTGLTLVTGWWGMVSAIINPFLILNNMFRYLASLGLPDGGDGAFPEQNVTAGGNMGGNRLTATTGNAARIAPPPASAPPAALAAYQHDILMRLRGGQTPQQIAAFVAPRAGVPAATVQAYAESLRGKS